jgi:hypothetical protein
MTIFFLGMVVHEVVHLYQIWEDHNLKFISICANTEDIFISQKINGAPKYGSLDSEVQAYGVQLIFLSCTLGFMILKKEYDQQDTEKTLKMLKEKYFQEIRDAV